MLYGLYFLVLIVTVLLFFNVLSLRGHFAILIQRRKDRGCREFLEGVVGVVKRIVFLVSREKFGTNTLLHRIPHLNGHKRWSTQGKQPGYLSDQAEVSYFTMYNLIFDK